MKNSILKQTIDDYKNRTLSSSKLINLKDAKELPGFEEYYYNDLKNTIVKGFPIGSDFEDNNGNKYSMNDYENLSEEKKKECKLKYYYLPHMHEVCIGTTGSGKTTGCVEPELRALSSQKNKPNLFITDPKGELFEHNAEHLKNNGYNIFVLNFKDSLRTDKWNPLIEIYDSYIRMKDYIKEAEFKLSFDPSLNLTIIGENINPNEPYLKLNNYAFKDFATYNNYVSLQRDIIINDTDSLINQFIHVFCYTTDAKRDEWFNGAKNLAEGLILAMLEDAIYDPSFTRDMFTIKTLFQYYFILRADLVSNRKSYSFDEHPLLINKQRALEKCNTALNNAPNTMSGYCGVFESITNSWKHGHIYSITTGNTIDSDDLDKTFAIFIITRDYEKSDFQIAGLFINWIYNQLIKKTEKLTSSQLRNIRATHFLLDEFANIPKIQDFENKIATARSRNIWMHLYIQSYEQLSYVYSREQAEIILANCNNHIFLGSQSTHTINEYSESCGTQSTRALNNDLTLSTSFTNTPVLNKSKLDLIEVGSFYSKRLYTPVMYSHFIRSYFLADIGYYNDYRHNCLNTIAPYNNEGYSLSKYTYSKINELNIINNND